MKQQATLGYVLTGIEAGKSFQTSETLAREDELGVLKVSAVTWSAFRPDEAKAVVGYEPDDRHRVRSGDLLISRANTRELVGAVVLVEKDYPFRLLSDKTLRLIVDTRKADKGYLLYALRSTLAREHIEHFATGTSDSMRNIAQGVITSIPLELPALGEQRRIAAHLKAQLASVAEARQAAQAQLQEIELLPSRLLAQVFGPSAQ
jgi:type I restriction enzyme S subunit